MRSFLMLPFHYYYFFFSVPNAICGGQSEAGLPAKAGRPIAGYRLSNQQGSRETF